MVNFYKTKYRNMMIFLPKIDFWKVLFVALIAFSLSNAAQAQNALSFDGVNDMVPSSTLINIEGSQERTVEAWIQTTDSGAQHIVGWGVLVTGERFDLRLQDSYLRLESENGPIIGLNTILNDGEWHHVAVVVPPGVNTIGGVLMYVDGVLEPHTDHFRVLETVNTPITIGSNPLYPDREFNGKIDEVRIWNIARSEEDINQYMNTNLCDTTGLAARYSFNEGVPGGDNTAITTTVDQVSGIGSDLVNFAMNDSVSNFVDGVLFEALSVTDFQTSCEPYTWINGVTYDSSIDTVTFFIQASSLATCDSLITLNLTVVNADVTTNDPMISADFPGASYQWLDCDNNLEPIPGATNQTFSASENGNYAVQVTFEDCTLTSDCVNIVAVSTKDADIFEATSIYPNPNHGEVNIKLGSLEKVDISIVDITGKSVFEAQNIRTKNYKFNLDAPAGMYLIELKSEGQYRNFRLVVQK
jgi:hypothetical protein